MKIPARFQLAGSEWTVVYVPNLTELGHCHSEGRVIQIRKGLSKQDEEQTFYHELVHAILFTMGKINHDEEFTDLFGAFLHQFEKTKK